MRIYKVYRKNELVKAIFSANDIDNKFNPRLLFSASTTLLGSVVIEFLKSNFDDLYINSVQAGASCIILYCVLVAKNQFKKKYESLEKLKELQEYLLTQGIKVDFIDGTNEIAEYNCDGIDYVNVAIDEVNDIVCFQDGTVEYVDSEENRKDITDEVYKIILSEKKYKKYIKRKNKSGE